MSESTPPGPEGQTPNPAGQPGPQQPYPGQQPYAGQPYPPQPQYAPQPGGVYQQVMSDADQRMWSTLAHVLGIVTGFIAPLIIYLVCKDRGEYVRYQSREALNFQLTLIIAYIVGSITSLFVIGIFILIAAGICAIVFGIMAAVASNKGEPYRYPISIRMVS